MCDVGKVRHIREKRDGRFTPMGVLPNVTLLEFNSLRPSDAYMRQ